MKPGISLLPMMIVFKSMEIICTPAWAMDYFSCTLYINHNHYLILLRNMFGLEEQGWIL